MTQRNLTDWQELGNGINEENEPTPPELKEEKKETVSVPDPYLEAIKTVEQKYSKKNKIDKEQVNVWVTPEVKAKVKKFVAKNKRGAISELVNDYLEKVLKDY